MSERDDELAVQIVRVMMREIDSKLITDQT